MTSTIAIILLWFGAGLSGTRTALPIISTGQRIFLFGFFSLISMYVVAVCFLYFRSQGSFDQHLVLLVCAVIFLFLVLFCRWFCSLSDYVVRRDSDGSAGGAKAFPAKFLFQVPVILIFVMFFSAYLYRMALEPMWGWDALWYWALVAFDILGEQEKTFCCFVEHSKDSWLFDAAPHPATSSALLAFPMLGVELGEGLPSLYWILTFSSLLTMAYGHALSITFSALFSLVLVTVFASVPLLENLASSVGYAEIFVCGSIFAFSAAFGFRTEHRLWILLCCLPLFSLLIIKNTGLILFLIMIGAAFLQILYDRGISFRLLVGLFAAVILLAFLVVCFLQYLEWPITLGSRTLEFDVFRWPLVFRNEFHGKVVNQSFSILAVLLALSFAVCFSLISNKKVQPPFPEQPFLFFSITGVLGMLLLAQLSTYGFDAGQPLSDTIISRHSLPLATLIIMTVPHIYLAASNGLHGSEDS